MSLTNASFTNSDVMNEQLMAATNDSREWLCGDRQWQHSCLLMTLIAAAGSLELERDRKRRVDSVTVLCADSRMKLALPKLPMVSMRYLPH